MFEKHQEKERKAIEKGWVKCKAFCVRVKEMNPEDHEELYFCGEDLEEALTNFFYETEVWTSPDYPDMFFEEIDEVMEYMEK